VFQMFFRPQETKVESSIIECGELNTTDILSSGDKRVVDVLPLQNSCIMLMGWDGSAIYDCKSLKKDADLELKANDPIHGLADGRIICGRNTHTDGPLPVDPRIIHMQHRRKFINVNADEILSPHPTHSGNFDLYRCSSGFDVPYTTLSVGCYSRYEVDVLYLGVNIFLAIHSNGRVETYRRADKDFILVGEMNLLTYSTTHNNLPAEHRCIFKGEHLGGSYILVREIVSAPHRINDYYAQSIIMKVEGTNLVKIHQLPLDFKFVGHFFSTSTTLRFVTADYREIDNSHIDVWNSETGRRCATYSFRNTTSGSTELQHTVLDDGTIIDYTSRRNIQFLKYCPEFISRQVAARVITAGHNLHPIAGVIADYVFDDVETSEVRSSVRP
jgi:hypothetical protein